MCAARLPDGLYAITDSVCTPPATLCRQVAGAIEGGAVVIQYRDKQADGQQRRERAAALLQVCRERQVPLLINDDIELAAALQADGVHLGETDGSAAAARARLGPRALIGVSCYNRLERAAQACREGADYLAFGRFYPSRSKPGAVLADPGLLTRARHELPLPVVAIGGITPENGALLVAAGANLLAAIEGVFCQSDPAASAARYCALFRRPGADSAG